MMIIGLLMKQELYVHNLGTHVHHKVYIHFMTFVLQTNLAILHCSQAVVALNRAAFGEGSGQITDISCQDNPEDISDCSIYVLPFYYCIHDKDASLRCCKSITTITCGLDMLSLLS